MESGCAFGSVQDGAKLGVQTKINREQILRYLKGRTGVAVYSFFFFITFCVSTRKKYLYFKKRLKV